MSSLLFQNVDTLITCDDHDTVLHHVNVYCENGVIRDISGDTRPADTVVDASRMWMYPGLINTHHHLYQFFTRNLPQVQNMELFDWLKTLYEIWKRIDADTVRLSSLAGMAELMRYGCTTCFDHHYVFPQTAPDTLIDAQFAAADELTIRMHASRGSMSLSKKDGGLPPDSVVQETDAILKDSLRLIETYHDSSAYSMRQVALAPCSPFSVTADLMRESAALARVQGVRLHTHLCETKDEERYTLEKTGMRPYDYMESLGWTGSDVWYAHGIHFNDDELARMAKNGTGVAHCPCSNMKLSSGVCRVPDMLRLNIPVGLAVDGSASNDSSNLLEEIRAAYLLHRLTWGADAPSGYDILKMATRGSARLLGRDKLGQIAVGCAADAFLIRYDTLELLGTHLDPKNVFGTVGLHRPVDCVVVAGKITVRDGRLTTIDEERLYRDGRANIEKILETL